MGYSTAYLGALRIEPPLNSQETAWLRAYQRSARSLQDDPYSVPMNPGVIPQDHPEVFQLKGGGSSFSAASQSGGPSPCDWRPSTDGKWLHWVKSEKSNNAIPTLQFLINHFLRPGALAQGDGRAAFEAFTFDHVANGTIAAERDDGELFLIVAEENELERTVLVQGLGLW